MLQRNLVYTGLTRGKQLVVLVGQKKALAMAVKNRLGRRRYTKLAEWLAPVDATTAPLAIRVSPSSQAIRHAHRN